MYTILLRLWDWLKAPILARLRQHGAAFLAGFLLGAVAGAWCSAIVGSLWHHKTISEIRATNETLKEKAELLRIQTNVLLDARPISSQGPQKRTDAKRTYAPGGVPTPHGDRIQDSVGDAEGAARALREAGSHKTNGYTFRALSSCLTAYKLLPTTVKRQLNATEIRLAFTDEINEIGQLNEAFDHCQKIFDNPAAHRFIGGKGQ